MKPRNVIALLDASQSSNLREFFRGLVKIVYEGCDPHEYPSIGAPAEEEKFVGKVFEDVMMFTGSESEYERLEGWMHWALALAIERSTGLAIGFLRQNYAEPPKLPYLPSVLEAVERVEGTVGKLVLSEFEREDFLDYDIEEEDEYKGN